MAKVIFLHLFVILFTGGCLLRGGELGGLVLGGVCSGGSVLQGGSALQGVSGSRGGEGGGCLVLGVYAPVLFKKFFFYFFLKFF